MQQPPKEAKRSEPVNQDSDNQRRGQPKQQSVSVDQDKGTQYCRKCSRVGQHNLRKQSVASQSTKTMATNVITGNQYNEEQVEAKLKKCNILQSNIIQAASKVDITQSISNVSTQLLGAS
jgi:hypothetical protein